MIFLSSVVYVIAIPLISRNITSITFLRITIGVIILTLIINYELYINNVYDHITLYSGNIFSNNTNLFIEIFIIIMGIFCITPIIINPNKELIGASFASNPIHGLLIFISIIGSILMISTYDIPTIYLMIELQSFAIYILTALYNDNTSSSTYAGLKYFLLGALSSAIILLGIAIMYMYTGSLNFYNINMLISVSTDFNVYIGLSIITLGILFKVAAAPFHWWAADVYDGAPTFVSTWLIVIPKIAFIILLINIYDMMLGINNVFIYVSLISVIVGSITGIVQNRIKRILAYSTIAHVGFITIALTTLNETLIYGEYTLLFYLVTYSITNFIAFSILVCTSNKIENIINIKGLYHNNPVLAISLSISLFSIAGIPPLVGFFAKYNILNLLTNNNYWFISVVAVLASVISSVYYLGLISIIFFYPNKNNENTYNFSTIHAHILGLSVSFLVFYVIIDNLIINSVIVIAISNI